MATQKMVFEPRTPNRGVALWPGSKTGKRFAPDCGESVRVPGCPRLHEGCDRSASDSCRLGAPSKAAESGPLRALTLFPERPV